MADLGCIYCGRPTGSREHTFPAGLGGRRFNKGILCARCNGNFSAMDQDLVEQLNLLNGLIGVRSDHRDVPRPAVMVEARTNVKYAIQANGMITLAEPVVREVSREGTRTRTVVDFASRAEAQAYLARMKQEGKTPRQVQWEERVTYFTQPTASRLHFGGASTMREVARIALNFLAHYFPVAARQPGLDPLKAYITGGGPNTFVNFSLGDALTQPPMEYPFGHRVLVAVERESQQAWAWVSIFSCFNLYVRLGAVSVERTETVVTDINPLAEHPPHDVKEQRFAEALHRMMKAPTNEEVGTAAVQATTTFFQRVQDRRWEEDAQVLVPALNQLRGLPAAQRLAHIDVLLQEQRQRALNPMGEGVRQITEHWKSSPESVGSPVIQALIQALKASIQPGPAGHNGLAPQTEALLKLVCRRFSMELAQQLERAPVTSLELRLLLEGGLGIVLALEVIRDAFQSAIQAETMD
ncbi:HNH endonuclease [Cystobacter ferrugineus]|uniref:Uncharacterized protein n=1 Tax=Cystobacter ferrugineus TaxID=83449 RepID=A0A1L9BDT5_9BACT|nr:HNH endonuclease [Cystobacter ferrugineus]OJH40393.1 hypothetical protein BON30_15330 [Cystobacter ferrugineus]